MRPRGIGLYGGLAICLGVELVGVNASAQIQAQQRPQAGVEGRTGYIEARTATVDAAAGDWIQPDIHVERGGRLEVTATGRWVVDGVATGPDGVAGRKVSNEIMQGANLGALIGRFGSHSYPFVIGSKFDGEVTGDEPLLLFVNRPRASSGPNAGQLTLRLVAHSRPSPPPTLAPLPTYPTLPAIPSSRRPTIVEATPTDTTKPSASPRPGAATTPNTNTIAGQPTTRPTGTPPSTTPPPSRTPAGAPGAARPPSDDTPRATPPPVKPPTRTPPLEETPPVSKAPPVKPPVVATPAPPVETPTSEAKAPDAQPTPHAQDAPPVAEAPPPVVPPIQPEVAKPPPPPPAEWVKPVAILGAAALALLLLLQFRPRREKYYRHKVSAEGERKQSPAAPGFAARVVDDGRASQTLSVKWGRR